MNTKSDVRPGRRAMTVLPLVLVPLPLWLMWLSLVEEHLYIEIYMWGQHRDTWQFDEHMVLVSGSVMFLAGVVNIVVAWYRRLWWVAGFATVVGVVAVTAAMLGAVAEAARVAPPDELTADDLGELDYAMDRLRTVLRREAELPSVTVGLARLEVLRAEGRLLLLGRPRALLRRAVPLRSGSRGRISDYPLGSSTVSQELLPKDFPALKARVLEILEARGGLAALEGRHVPGGAVETGELSDMGRYLTWRYPDHLVLVVVLDESVRAERVDDRTLRLSVPAGTAHNQSLVVLDYWLEDAPYSSSYRLFGPDSVMGDLVNSGPGYVLRNLARRPQTYADVLRLVFGMNAQQAALEEAGACWLQTQPACK